MQVYLEPGEAVALNAGYLVTQCYGHCGKRHAPLLILDASAACHMPDVLEMPYRPPLRGCGTARGEGRTPTACHSCTCLAGDVIGDYSFDQPIHVGDRLMF